MKSLEAGKAEYEVALQKRINAYHIWMAELEVWYQANRDWNAIQEYHNKNGAR